MQSVEEVQNHAFKNAASASSNSRTKHSAASALAPTRLQGYFMHCAYIAEDTSRIARTSRCVCAMREVSMQSCRHQCE